MRLGRTWEDCGPKRRDFAAGRPPKSLGNFQDHLSGTQRVLQAREREKPCASICARAGLWLEASLGFLSLSLGGLCDSVGLVLMEKSAIAVVCVDVLEKVPQMAMCRRYRKPATPISAFISGRPAVCTGTFSPILRLCGIFLVEDVERRQADVRDFLLAKKEFMRL